MRQANRDVIAAAEAYFSTSGMRAGVHNDLMDAVRALHADRAARQVQPWPRPIAEEPPVGASVRDRDGDVWVRKNGGWDVVSVLDGRRDAPWYVVLDFAPLVLLSEKS